MRVDQSVECPKCGSSGAWTTKTKTDVVMRCLCGLYRVLSTTIETVEIRHQDPSEKVNLPRRGSNLWDTLAVLAVIGPASTREVTERLEYLGRDFSPSDVSTYLAVLRSKGLVLQLNARRGQLGGSTWDVTDTADRLIGG